jgi:hypothetical protein
MHAAEWPEPYTRTHAVDPIPGAPSRGSRVRVVNGSDTRADQIGTVRRTWLDAGELMARVQFDDGTTDEFWVHELLQRPKRCVSTGHWCAATVFVQSR